MLIEIFAWLDNLSFFKKVLIIIAIGVFVYGNSFLNNFLFDDYGQIVGNPQINSLANIPNFFASSTFYTGGNDSGGIYYKPLLSTVYTIINVVGVGTPFFFHLFQICLHILNAILIFLIFKKFLNEWLSYLLALLFLVHPMNVETVVYVAALQDTMFLTFGLAATALVIYHEFKPKLAIVVWFLLAASILSKETGVLFLIVLPIYIHIFRRKHFKLGLFVSVAVFALYAWLRFGVAHIYFDHVPIIPMMSAPLWMRLFNIPTILSFYIFTFFVPLKLIVLQSWIVVSPTFMNFVLPLFIDIVFFASVFKIGAYLHKHYQKQFPLYLFFTIWLIVGLGLHMQIIALDTTVSDRWFYFPMVGILAMIGIFAEQVLKKPKQWAIFSTVVFVVIILLSVRTIVRTYNWRDGLTLAAHDIMYSPPSTLLENAYGGELYPVGRYEEALVHFKKSVELYPAFNLVNLGTAYMHFNQVPEAKDALIKAINQNGYYLAYENLADLLLMHDTPENTIAATTQFLEIYPNDPVLWYVLAIAEYKVNDIPKAIEASKKAAELNPDNGQYELLYQSLSKGVPIRITNTPVN